MPKAKAFYGKWIFSPESSRLSPSSSEPWADFYAVAITAKGAAVVFSWTEDPDYDVVSQRFHIYASLEAAALDDQVAWAAKKTLEKVGVPVEELDI